MIRLLILLIFAAIAFAVAYFFLKSVPKAKKITVLGGGILAAVIGILLQSAMPFYMALLAIVAISLLIALVYTKQMEKEQQLQKQQAEERKAARQHLIQPAPEPTVSNPIHEDTLNKSFGMQSIDPDRKER